MRKLPYLLILTRFILAPIIVFVAYFFKNPGKIIAVLMTLGLLTDIFDGIVARKLNLSTEKMRRLDSQTDLIFWMAIGFSTWFLNESALTQYSTSIIVLFVMELLCYIISIIKFKRETCTHAYLSKLFGLTMFVAFYYLLVYEQGGSALLVAIIIGLVSHLDRILITLILPHWMYDVPSFYHAYQIKQGKKIKKFILFN